MTRGPLVVDEEVDCGAVQLRWVVVPKHLTDDCRCGRRDVLLVSTPEHEYWSPAAMVVPGHRPGAVEDLWGTAGSEWERGVAVYSAAFGMPWSELSVLAIRGLFVLLDALEAPTVTMLHRLDPVRLLEMRLACPSPSGVVRSLRLMRDYGEARQ